MADVQHQALTEPDAIHPAAYVASTDPATTYPSQIATGQLWVDTSSSTYVLKKRNAANNGWDTVAAISHANLTALATGDPHTQYILKSLVDAKGDILTATADDTPARLGVGANGRVLVADSAEATGLRWSVVAGLLGLDDLSDVVITSPATGAVLKFNGTNWIDDTDVGFANPMTTAEDIIKGGASGAPARLAKGNNGDVLTINGSGAVAWVAPAGGTNDLDDLGDVNAPSPNNGDVLTWDSTPGEWVAAAPGAAAAYDTVEDEGTGLTARDTINFVGRGVIADDSGSKTRVRIDDIITMLHLIDDFCSGAVATSNLGDLGWHIAGAGTATSGVAAEAGHPGILRYGTGSVSGSFCSLILRNITTAAVFLAAELFDIRILMRLNTNDSNTIARVGLGVSVTGAPTDGIYVEKTAADTSWYGVCRNGGTETRTAALVATGTGWVAFRIRRIDASTIGFTYAATLAGLDAATELTVTTNIPTSTQIIPFLQCGNTTTAAKNCDIDVWDLVLTGLSR